MYFTGLMIQNDIMNCILNNNISSRISSISLKFSGTMDSTMEQIVVKMAMLGHFFACSAELWNFPWQAFLTMSEGQCYPSSLRILAIGLKFGGMMHNDMKQIAKMAMLVKFLHIPGLDQVWVTILSL